MTTSKNPKTLQKFTVLKPRLVYDEYEIEAHTPRDAAYRLIIKNNPQDDAELIMKRYGIEASHDTFYDTLDSIIVIDPSNTDKTGFAKIIEHFDEQEFT